MTKQRDGKLKVKPHLLMLLVVSLLSVPIPALALMCQQFGTTTICDNGIMRQQFGTTTIITGSGQGQGEQPAQPVFVLPPAPQPATRTSTPMGICIKPNGITICY